MVTYKEPLELMGVPGSPYTRKMLGLLRYRRIAYRLLPGSRHMLEAPSGRYPGRPEPKVRLLPTFYGRNEAGAEVAECDSTPLIRRFEEVFTGRSVIPDDPALAFLDYLLEDYADEWLTKAMFHYRWSYAADIAKAGQMLPRWNNITAPDTQIDDRGRQISDLQISRLSYVGSNELTRDTIEQSFIRFLDLFDKHLNQLPFLFGERPSAADFAVYGQLTCLALFDPTPQQIVLERAPRVYAWTEVLEDLSGYAPLEGDWLQMEALPESLVSLLAEVGRVYVPYLLANAQAVANGASRIQTSIDGRPWEQSPFPYHSKCLQWISDEYEKLDNTAQTALFPVFDRAGISPVIS
ncbi:MAG: glutathione S-transferase C-terminal domain-containing protein [Proteobacteria bacterium]|nr:glutathione S-transferase C-terminal domain-containing protein [Pseudomonadota bacterium]